MRTNERRELGNLSPIRKLLEALTEERGSVPGLSAEVDRTYQEGCE